MYHGPQLCILQELLLTASGPGKFPLSGSCRSEAVRGRDAFVEVAPNERPAAVWKAIEGPGESRKWEWPCHVNYRSELRQTEVQSQGESIEGQ
jgi:hypothetical protein